MEIANSRVANSILLYATSISHNWEHRETVVESQVHFCILPWVAPGKVCSAGKGTSYLQRGLKDPSVFYSSPLGTVSFPVHLSTVDSRPGNDSILATVSHCS